MPRPMRICDRCGKRVGTWWDRDDTTQCGSCTLEVLADEGLIRKGEPNAPGWAGLHQRRRENMAATKCLQPPTVANDTSDLEVDLAIAHARIKTLESIVAADKDQLEAWRSARRSTGNPQFREALRSMQDEARAAIHARDQALAERDDVLQRYDPDLLIPVSELAEVLRESPSSTKRFLLNRTAGLLRAATRRRSPAP